jgi:hypothetical protein
LIGHFREDQVSSPDEQRNFLTGGAQIPCRMATDDARTADEENRIR